MTRPIAPYRGFPDFSSVSYHQHVFRNISHRESSPPQSSTPNYNQHLLPGCFWTYSTRRIQWYHPLGSVAAGSLIIGDRIAADCPRYRFFTPAKQRLKQQPEPCSGLFLGLFDAENSMVPTAWTYLRWFSCYDGLQVPMP